MKKILVMEDDEILNEVCVITFKKGRCCLYLFIVLRMQKKN